METHEMRALILELYEVCERRLADRRAGVPLNTLKRAFLDHCDHTKFDQPFEELVEKGALHTDYIDGVGSLVFSPTAYHNRMSTEERIKVHRSKEALT